MSCSKPTETVGKHTKMVVRGQGAPPSCDLLLI